MSNMDQPTMTDAEIMALMRQGQGTQFWAELVRITRENIAMIEEQIITKTSVEPGHEGEELTDHEVDRLRDKREALLDLINTPDNIVNELRATDAPEDDEDPYRKHRTHQEEPG